jgi:hypothetical protein
VASGVKPSTSTSWARAGYGELAANMMAIGCTALLLAPVHAILGSMNLEGWNTIPNGYGASFDMASAPLWLRFWFQVPLADRFAYPIAVRCGFGALRAHPGSSAAQRGPVSSGWRVVNGGTLQFALSDEPTTGLI